MAGPPSLVAKPAIAGGEVDAALLRAAAESGDLQQARRLHQRVMAREEFASDRAIANLVVRMYIKCGSTREALQAFAAIAPSKREDSTWNAMIAAAGGFTARELYLAMRVDRRPNKVTFLSVLGSIRNDDDDDQPIDFGRRVHRDLVHDGLPMDAILGTAVLAMYGRCGCIAEAQSAFVSMVDKDVISWNAMISAYALNSNIGGSSWASAAVETFDRMLAQGVSPNKSTLVSLLRCSSSLQEAKFVHAKVLSSKCFWQSAGAETIVETAAITMYAMVGSLELAKQTFDFMTLKDAVTWNAMIAANAQSRHCEESFRVFRLMQLEGVNATRVTFITLLGICNAPIWLPEGRCLHRRIIEVGYFDCDVLVTTALLTMYANCGRLEDARQVFEAMSTRNVASWNAIITAFADRGYYRNAMTIFQRMSSSSAGVTPNRATYLSVLNSCSSPDALEAGREIHSQVREFGVHKMHLSIANAIVNMYAKCGSINEAIRLFWKMTRKNSISWNVIIACLTPEEPAWALQVFYNMQLEGTRPNEITAAAIITACANLRKAKAQSLINVLISGDLKVDMVLGNALLNFYCGCGKVEECETCFCNMLAKDHASWSTMISLYAQSGLCTDALLCFKGMVLEGFNPDGTTFRNALLACRHAGLIEEACHIFITMREQGVEPENEHYGCILDILGKKGLG